MTVDTDTLLLQQLQPRADNCREGGMISARWTSVSEADHQAGRRGQEAHLSCLVCRCPVPVCPRWPDSARPLSRKSLEMARCRGRWSDFWQTPDPPPACDTPMAWNYPAMIGPLPRCLRRGPQGKKKKKRQTLSHRVLPREEEEPVCLSVCPCIHLIHPLSLIPPPPQLHYLRQASRLLLYCLSTLPMYLHLTIQYLPVSALSDALGLCGTAIPQRAKSAHSQVTSRGPQHALRTSF